VVTSSLQDDLLDIPGVEGAEIDGSQEAPAGLRIRIAEGADQETVGTAIRRVLSSHGLGTDTQLPGESDVVPLEAPSSDVLPELGSVAVLAPEEDVSVVDHDAVEDDVPEPESRAVIDLTDKRPEPVDSGEPLDDDASELLQASVAPRSWEQDHLPPFVEQRPIDAPEDEAEEEIVGVLDDGTAIEDVAVIDGEQESAPERGGSIARLDSVAVVEGRLGIVVTVTASNGSDVSHAAASSEGGVEAAVVKAAAKLVDSASPDPIVVEIEDRRVEGVDIVMIVLDMDGRLVAGSAVVEAGRAFALGRATWAALAL
jgi:hypothetical protein